MGEVWDSTRALAEVARDGDPARIPALAEQARAALAPVSPEWLSNRLSMLWLAMGHSKSTEQATAWLHEMTRLLADLPQDILGNAIDEAVKESERGFMPSVGAIRAKAETPLAHRRRKVARLEAMARLLASGHTPKPLAAKPIEEPEFDPANRCTPEQAAAVMDEFPSLKAETIERLKRHLGPARKPTREDYIAMGVDPSVLDGMESIAA